MQITLNIVLASFIALIIFVVGNYLGLLEGRGQGYKKRQKEEAEDPKAKTVSQTPLPNLDPPAMPVENSPIKLSFDQNNRPRLDLDGRRVEVTSITSEQRKRLIDLMTQLRPWIEDPTAQKPSTPLRPPAAQTPSLSRPITSTSPIQVPPLAASISQLMRAPLSAASVIPKQDAAPTSMVAQIEAILQMRLIGTPLADQGIHLVESIQGGVNVMVGAEKYDGIADVPDAQIIALIRAAVAEWEKKYTPGI